ncbi:hypothetical protein F5Y11DRAFT_365579 [Daldinia sp. FL1419]|nr:hypothetical protein F5Y11DRAFT_365579 [Daldinia sp. FL1419]
MSSFPQALRQCGYRPVALLASRRWQHRYLSWVAWGQPGPAVYTRPHADPSSENQPVAINAHTRYSVRESTTPLAAVTVQAGISHVSFSQTRSIQTKAEDKPLLPTTLLRIPGVTATWPDITSEHPDQPRVRKRVNSLQASEKSEPERIKQVQAEDTQERPDSDKKSS